MKKISYILLSFLLFGLPQIGFSWDENNIRNTNQRIKDLIQGRAGEYPLSDFSPEQSGRTGSAVNQMVKPWDDPRFMYRKTNSRNPRAARRKHYYGTDFPTVRQERSYYAGQGRKPDGLDAPVPKISRQSARSARETGIMLQQVLEQQR